MLILNQWFQRNRCLKMFMARKCRPAKIGPSDLVFARHDQVLNMKINVLTKFHEHLSSIPKI